MSVADAGSGGGQIGGGGQGGTGPQPGAGGASGAGGGLPVGGAGGVAADGGGARPADAPLGAGVMPALPRANGACPEFAPGAIKFNPMGGERTVTITMTEAARTMRGPLIFYWHATNSDVDEAARGLPLAQVTAAGGIVVAPQDVAGAGTFPWLSQLSQHDLLFDEVLACAAQKTMIDTRRVHAVGFSAGALMTTHLSFARSKYLASVAAYSGGASQPFQDPTNKFAAMIMTGGPRDVVVQNFFNSSQQWHQRLKQEGYFAVFCDHGGGHSIPARLVPGVWQFFQDHPYGTKPSPYAGKLPAAISPPCVE